MKRESVWLILLLIGFNATGRGFAQSGERFETRSVEWPGLGKTTAVCVQKGGLYVCVLPGGAGADDPSPKVFNEKGEEQPAKLLHCDNDSGICLLESPSGSESTIIPLAAGANFHPGQSLLSLLPGTELKTRLAGKDRVYLGKELPAPMLRLRVERGGDWQPGTPVINKEGELEGIMASRKLALANEAHAVPADVIRKVINDVETRGMSAPVRVGMVFRSNTSTPQVIEIKKDSPAEDAGIKPFDVILQVNDREIEDIDDLVEQLKILPGGVSATFKVLRDLDEIQLTVVPEFVK